MNYTARATTLTKLITVVLYRTNISESSTLQSLLKSVGYISKNDSIVIWDNSPEPQTSQDIELYRERIEATVTYRHTPKNISLAKVYNSTVGEYRLHNILYLFDQDSTFDGRFFDTTDRAIEAHPDINLFLPLIRKNKIIVSPGHFHYFKGKYWSKESYGKVRAKNNIAIMSGMAIRMKYLHTFGGFEEQLQLYGIDTNFMLRYSKDNHYFYVTNAVMEHDLSDFNAESREAKQRRFEDFRRASIINSKLFSLPVQLLTHLFLWYKKIRS